MTTLERAIDQRLATLEKSIDQNQKSIYQNQVLIQKVIDHQLREAQNS